MALATPGRSWDGRPLDWRNKATDRFILRWTKRRLSAPLTLVLRRLGWVRPGMVTAAAAALGVGAAALLALGYAVAGGALAAVGQVLDGVDGQLARLTGRESRAGAFWDSVLDRYADGALMAGTAAYLARLPHAAAWWLPAVLATAVLAFVGANLVSYTSARAGQLGVDLGRPTLASKGTRTAALVAGALAAGLWPPAPALALAYIAVHANAAALRRLVVVARAGR